MNLQQWNFDRNKFWISGTFLINLLNILYFRDGQDSLQALEKKNNGSTVHLTIANVKYIFGWECLHLFRSTFCSDFLLILYCRKVLLKVDPESIQNLQWVNVQLKNEKLNLFSTIKRESKSSWVYVIIVERNIQHAVRNKTSFLTNQKYLVVF